jgi:hypothetical protein
MPLRIEAAADLARHHPDLAMGHAEDLLGEQSAEAVGRLDAGVERVAPAAPIELSHRPAGLQRQRGHAGDHEVEVGHVRGFLEGARHRVARAGLPEEGHVVGRLVPHRGGPGGGGRRGADHRGPRLVVDHHQLGGVGGLLRGLGHDERHRIAHVTDPLPREGRPRRREGGRTVPALPRGIGGQVPEPVGREIGAGQHGQRAGGLPGVGGADAEDPRVRVRRAHDHGVGLTRQIHVVGVAAQPLEEPPVLHAADGLAHRELLARHRFTHGALAWTAHERPRARRPGPVAGPASGGLASVTRSPDSPLFERRTGLGGPTTAPRRRPVGRHPAGFTRVVAHA